MNSICSQAHKLTARKGGESRYGDDEERSTNAQIPVLSLSPTCYRALLDNSYVPATDNRYVASFIPTISFRFVPASPR